MDDRVGAAAVVAGDRRRAVPGRLDIGDPETLDRGADAARRHGVDIGAGQQRRLGREIVDLAEEDDAVGDAEIGRERLQPREIGAAPPTQ